MIKCVDVFHLSFYVFVFFLAFRSRPVILINMYIGLSETQTLHIKRKQNKLIILELQFQMCLQLLWAGMKAI